MNKGIRVDRTSFKTRLLVIESTDTDIIHKELQKAIIAKVFARNTLWRDLKASIANSRLTNAEKNKIKMYGTRSKIIILY